jgi:serine/threonine-protein kinase
MSQEYVGRYEIRSLLGRGGMATVYHAYDPRFGRDVAIKVLPREFLHDPTFIARFEREVQTITSLEHPAVVPVYDFGEYNGQPYLVMRYMPGGSLAARIRTGAGPLALGEAAALVDRIAAALDRAHQRGIIHRDVKPANILFDEMGSAYLSDFGIVKVSETTAQLTGSGVIGTPAYLAPEMADKGGTTYLVDIYSLGVTLFEALAGQLPYDADTPVGLMMAHASKPIPHLRTFRPDLPASIEQVLAGALSKDPAGRYQTAGDLAADLRAVAAGVGAAAMRPPVMPVAQPPLVPPTAPPVSPPLSPPVHPADAVTIEGHAAAGALTVPMDAGETGAPMPPAPAIAAPPVVRIRRGWWRVFLGLLPLAALALTMFLFEEQGLHDSAMLLLYTALLVASGLGVYGLLAVSGLRRRSLIAAMVGIVALAAFVGEGLVFLLGKRLGLLDWEWLYPGSVVCYIAGGLALIVTLLDAVLARPHRAS